MIDVPRAFQGKPYAPKAFRLNALLIVIALGWFAFAAQHVLTGMQKMATVDAVAVALTLVVRWWALRSGEERRVELGAHFAMVVSCGAIIAVSMFSGQEAAMATWYLTAVPLFAAYQLDTRAAVAWTGVVSVIIIGVYASGQFVQFEPEYVPDAQTWLIGKFVLLGVLLGLSVATRRAMDAYVAALGEREAIIRDRARELADARDDALEAVRAKNQFLANMSHEIRTPLNGIIGMTSVLIDSPQPDDQREMVRTIQRSSTALLAILNEILDFSKLEAGAVELESIPFDLRECVEDVIDLFARAAHEKGIDLYVHSTGEVPRWIEGDITYLRQVLLNLVGNAVKFTDSGEVHIEIDAPEAGRLHFAIVDTGIGIPEDKYDVLFRSFSQVDTSTTRRFGGTGLGLAISKRLVDLMGGEIWFDSEQGEGSTFHFEIEAPEVEPRERPMTTRERVSLIGRRVGCVGGPDGSRGSVVSMVEGWGASVSTFASVDEMAEALEPGDLEMVIIFDRESLDGILALEAPPPIVLLPPLANTALREHAIERGVDAVVFRPARYRALRQAMEAIVSGESGGVALSYSMFDPTTSERLPARILIGEDNPVNQRVATAVLEKLGYEPDVASNGEEVLDALERRRYDILLIDLQMPGMDGIETARRIREDDDELWIVALTASVSAEQRQRALASGMNDFVGKPFDVQTLTATLERWGERRAVPGRNRESTPASVVDDPWKQLQQMFGRAPQKLAELVEQHLANGASLVRSVEANVESAELDEVKRVAHALKSSAAQFGSTDVAELARGIEELAERGKQDALEERIGSLRSAWRGAEERLRREVSDLRAAGGSSLPERL